MKFKIQKHIYKIIGFILFIITILFVYRYYSKNMEGMTDETTQSSTDPSTTTTTTTTADSSTPTYYDTSTYNHYSGANTIIYYAPDGTTASVTTLSNGTRAIVANNNIYVISPNTQNVYEYNGNTAIITTVNNQRVIKVTQTDGTVTIYSPSQNTGVTYNPSNTTNTTNTTNTSKTGTVTYTGPYGTSATVTTMGGITEIAVTFKNNNSSIFYIDKNNPSGTVYIDAYGDKATINQTNGTIVVTTRHGETMTYTRVSGTVGYTTSPSIYSSSPATFSSSSVTNTNTGNSAGSVTGPNGNSVYYVDNKPVTVNSVPPGDEDLYILKSQIVPPVCPVCPPSIIKKCDKEKECGPCPIQRCPTAPFKCVKQPDYSNPAVKQYLPIPVLSSFSTFGL